MTESFPIDGAASPAAHSWKILNEKGTLELNSHAPIRVSKEIRQALEAGQPAVALESTVITHGLPQPENLEVARRLEKSVREEGALPATIAILDGEVVVGASDQELERLAAASDTEKLNPGNLAAGVASGRPGSTTVAATMCLAHLAGIRVFATGGIGGVHRGAGETFDISADLDALGRFPVAVVSAGAKAILDLPKTVEALETRGVPVFGWRTNEFPAFYRRTSGLRVDWRFDDLRKLAAAVSTHWRLGLESGVLVANPVPEASELDLKVYERALDHALAQAKEKGVSGRDVTPFLLDSLLEATEGQSVFTNTALLENNVRLAARLARHVTGES